MRRRRSNLALAILALTTISAGATFLHAFTMSQTAASRQKNSIALVRDLGLTDLALFTDARYTRHPSQADLHSAFQDHPMALDHFPSGSLFGPPTGRFDSPLDLSSQKDVGL